MKYLTEELVTAIIQNRAIIKDYPKKGVNFIALDRLLNSKQIRHVISELVTQAISQQAFYGIVPIASRGYIFSGMLSRQKQDFREYLIQKIKTKGNGHYLQLDMQTEYSADALQIIKGSVKGGESYLVIDDLVATGGSLRTAIDLVRQSGGEVKTVFVMTELVDFPARKMLEQEGIELVSLLKFSDADLEEILKLQEAYHQSPQTPITYQLTHHQKGHRAMKAANGGKSHLEVHLASGSALKKAATEQAFRQLMSPLNIDVYPHQVDSDVSEQPLEQETMEGARHRLEKVECQLPDINDTVLVSIENGLRYIAEEDKYVDFVHVILKHRGQLYSVSQDCCEVPGDIITAIRKSELGEFRETWGQAAQRLGLADSHQDPHLGPRFGGRSREHYVTQALTKALGQLKAAMLHDYDVDLAEEPFYLKRQLKLNDESRQQAFADLGLEFIESPRGETCRPINFYNQGAPVADWQIPQEKIERNFFKIFQTGDSFSILSPDVEISGAHINIHVGLDHPSYTPATLLLEALQMCRTAYEHGAKSITIALPESFHPVLHYNDFNVMLVKLLKASGANRVFYYDKSYQGRLDEVDMQSRIAHVPKRSELSASLHFPNEHAQFPAHFQLDDKVMHFTRRVGYKSLWSQFDTTSTDILGYLSHHQLLPKFSIPKGLSRPHIVLCANANKALALKIVRELKMKGELVELYHIDGHGMNASIPAQATLCGATVTIVQSTRPNPDELDKATAYDKNGNSDYFFETMMIARLARLRGAKHINLVNPYQFNARSDKAEDNLKGRTGAYVQQNGLLLKACGINQVFTAECHDVHTMSGAYTGEQIRGAAVAALSVIATKLAREWVTQGDIQGQLRLVTPDAGAAKRTKALTQELQAVLGQQLCQERVLGEKQRDSHQDTSALIKSLNTGDVDINAADKFLISDDETATGTTLCQAIINLQQKGAKDISVIVVHNNMPLNWLERQLCLTRFLYMGVSDIHFSDTHPMGTMAESYQAILEHYSAMTSMPIDTVEQAVFAWFNKNVVKKFGNISQEDIISEFALFKKSIANIQSKVRVHSLAREFANKIKTEAYITKPAIFSEKVDALIRQIKQSPVQSIIALEGYDVAVASAVAVALNLPLKLIAQSSLKEAWLPEYSYALIGAAAEGYASESADCVIVPGQVIPQAEQVQRPSHIKVALENLISIYQTLSQDSRYQGRPLKLLAIGSEAQTLAGPLSYLLAKQGINIGIAAAFENQAIDKRGAMYTSETASQSISVDKSSLNMGDVCIALTSRLDSQSKQLIDRLTTKAKVHCTSYLGVNNMKLTTAAWEISPTSTLFRKKTPSLFFRHHPRSQTGQLERQKEQTTTLRRA